MMCPPQKTQVDASGEYYAQTMPGIEKIAWLEIRQRLPSTKFQQELFTKEKNGIILFEYAGSPEDLLTLRTVEDVFVVLLSAENLSRDWGDLRSVTRLLEGSDALDHAAQTILRNRRGHRPITFRVVSRKEGRHQYRRKDFEEAVFKGIERRYQGRWLPVEENADLEIWANVLGSRLLCGLRLSDRTMRHRGYQAASLPASLRPSVAAAMVFLTQPNAEDVFMDPMCGTGTIVAERLLAGPCRLALGGDISPQSILAAQQNLANLGKSYQLVRWDATRLPLPTQSIDKASVNLPFGKQIGSPTYVRELYPWFLAELERVLKPGGTATVLSSEYELVKDVLREHRGLRLDRGYSVAVLGQWGRVYILQRL